MNSFEWFSEQMTAFQLLCRVNIKDSRNAYMEFWTQYLGEEVIWGGARCTYSAGRWFSCDMTYYPMMKSQDSCAEESMAEWDKYTGWKQRKLIVLRMGDPRSRQVKGGNPLVLQFLRLAQGAINQEEKHQSSYEASLCGALADRIGGLVTAGNQELAELLGMTV